MKIIKLLSFVSLTLATLGAFGQNANNFKVSGHSNNVWTILETVSSSSNVNMYVVEGKDSALIIDTGFGSSDAKAYIQTLTKLPLIVVNTHGHGDHSGSNSQFSKVYLHPDDFYMVDAKADKNLSAIVGSVTYVPVREGHVFDLGGRKIEVIEVPGHTHGSIVLLDKENKILFAGDNTNSIVWLFLEDCYPLETYLKSLEKVQKRIGDFDIIMPGHNTSLVKTYLAEQIGCVKSILDGTCSPVHYNHPSNNSGALICKFQTAEVAYDPKKLRAGQTY
jgi:hydroxyacylglutathione hydrolase